MKSIALLLALLVGVPSIAAPTPKPVTAKVVAGTNNIPVAFDETAGSKVLTGLRTNVALEFRHLIVLNETSTRIAVVSVTANTSAPSASINERVLVPASSSMVLDNVHILDKVYIQSDGSAISSGTVTVTVF